MSFSYPLGLIGLIGVPILIIIYIIKTKHTEQIIPSTYLWNLSEKFLTKKKQTKRVSGLISLILQIIIVVTISLLIAHPVITLKNKAKEYCFIIDASGSMNATVDGKTKLEIGKDEVEKIINSSKDGSKYTLVYAGLEARVIYEKLENKEKAIELLEKVEPSGVTSSFTSVINYLQGYFNNNKSLVTYLITDREYTSDNINVINVTKDKVNYAINDVNYLIEDSNLKVTGNVISYEKDEELTIEFYLDEALVKEETVKVEKNIITSFNTVIESTEFTTLKVVIKNEDTLSIDNSYILYNIEKSTEYSVAIISDNPFYLHTAINTMGNASIMWIKPENYNSDIEGYDLYVYDSFTPSKLPTDGTIWLFGIEESIEGSGFSVQDVVENEEGIKLTYPKNSTSTYKVLTEGLAKEDIYVAKYAKYGLYKNFTTLLTVEGNPAVFTGLTDSGNREVVFAFDLHNSNFALLMDYLVLTKNLLNYSFPSVLNKTTYVCGDTALINVIPNIDSIRVESPEGNILYLDINKESNELKLTEAGIYKIITMSDDVEKEYLLFVSLPKEESATNLESINLSFTGLAENEYIDGKYDKLIVLFIILTVILMADWMVYCYDQYQLR